MKHKKKGTADRRLAPQVNSANSRHIFSGLGRLFFCVSTCFVTNAKNCDGITEHSYKINDRQHAITPSRCTSDFSAEHVEGSQCPSTKEGLTAYRFYRTVPFPSIMLDYILQQNSIYGKSHVSDVRPAATVKSTGPDVDWCFHIDAFI